MTKASCRAKVRSLGVTSFLLVFIHLRCIDVEALPVKIDVKPAQAQVEDAGIKTAVDFANISGVLKAKQTACFVRVIGRGVGVPLNSCPNGTETNGLLCYSACRDGYYGVGPMCWESCPPHHTDIGVFCIKTHGKGCCCTLFGCCGCPEGYTDDGCFCRKSLVKRIYGRGVGRPLSCSSGQERSGALCYPQCPDGFSGVGPVCHEANAPTKFPVKCNEIMWATNQSTCDTVNTNLYMTGGVSVACIGVVFAALAADVLWPVAPMVCKTIINDAVETVKEILELTGARTCPS